jgi:hypothetical protein
MACIFNRNGLRLSFGAMARVLVGWIDDVILLYFLREAIEVAKFVKEDQCVLGKNGCQMMRGIMFEL